MHSYDSYDIPCIRTSYAISYAFSCLPGPVQMWPLRLKSGSDPVQMRACSNLMRPLLIPYVCLSSLASKSGCSGLLIQTRRRGSRFRFPPSSPPRGPYGSVAPPEGTVLLPPLPPLVIKRWRETGGCAGRAAAARAFWRGYRRPPADMPRAVRCICNRGKVLGGHT